MAKHTLRKNILKMYEEKIKQIAVKEGKRNASELPSKINNKAYLQSFYK